VTSALLFVALLVVVDLSYRRWMRRSTARRRFARRVHPVRGDQEIVLDAPDASIVSMRARRETLPDQRRNI
jgi:hypothetical protein